MGAPRGSTSLFVSQQRGNDLWREYRGAFLRSCRSAATEVRCTMRARTFLLWRQLECLRLSEACLPVPDHCANVVLLYLCPKRSLFNGGVTTVTTVRGIAPPHRPWRYATLPPWQRRSMWHWRVALQTESLQSRAAEVCSAVVALPWCGGAWLALACRWLSRWLSDWLPHHRLIS